MKNVLRIAYCAALLLAAAILSGDATRKLNDVFD